MPFPRAGATRPGPTPAGSAPSAVPRPARGEVARRDLVRRLGDGPAEARLVLVSAPAGYGKTTLLAQWARGAGEPVAWLTVRPEHSAPRRLLHDIADALGPLLGAGTERPGSPAEIRRALARVEPPFLLVLDEADVLATPSALATVSALIADLPPGARIALGCRVVPDLLLGRRLMEGGLVRITADDLAFDAGEARHLMTAASVALDAEALADVLDRTEGWPAGLRLAALAIAGGPDPAVAARSFTGGDRLIGDYVRETMLDGLTPERLAFLVRTSVLDRLSAGACDAVTGATGSGLTLAELVRSGLPLVALDAGCETLRHHHLLRDALRAELRRREPEAIPDLHRRAGAWLEGVGDMEGAVRHTLAAGDATRAIALAWRSFPADLTRGRLDALRAVVAGFDTDRVAGSARLSLASAWLSVEARGDLVAHHLSRAERAAAPTDAADAQTLATGVATLRAMLGREGPEQMAGDAAEGFRTASDDGPWRAYCRFVEGVACHLGGEPERARALLEDGVERAGRVAPSVHALCLAQLALLLIDQDEPVRALMIARRARSVVQEWSLADYASASLSYAACALAFARSGHADEARDNLLETRRVLSRGSDACAWLGVEARLAIARSALEIGDGVTAWEALRETEQLLGPLRDTPVLREAVEQLGRRVRPVPEGDAACLSSISVAETRVLRLLPTHHSFREIGDLLFLSRFTVKSHAHSLYRKLGVSSRSEAVERARQLRILDGPPA